MDPLIGLLTALNIGLALALWIIHGVRSDRRRSALLLAKAQKGAWRLRRYPPD